MEEINRAGGNSSACHGQMYNMGTLLRHGSDVQKAHYLPKIASGELRLQSMGVSEPTTGSDTTKIKTTAERKGDRYVINGQKVWISRVQHSDLMILLARTTPLVEVKKKSLGMSIFIVDLKQAIGNGLEVKPIRDMVNHETNDLFFDNLEIPVENLIGEEGLGFKYILDGLNAERALIAAECIGDGYWFIDKVSEYVKERKVFGRPIGQNQGVQFPIAEAHIEIEAANLMRFEACRLFDAQQPCGAQANMAKYLAAKASWEAANACIQFHGGMIKESEYKYNNYLHQDSFVNATFWSGSPLRKKTEPPPTKVEGFSGLERLRHTVASFPTEVGGFKPDFWKMNLKKVRSSF